MTDSTVYVSSTNLGLPSASFPEWWPCISAGIWTRSEELSCHNSNFAAAKSADTFQISKAPAIHLYGWRTKASNNAKPWPGLWIHARDSRPFCFCRAFSTLFSLQRWHFREHLKAPDLYPRPCTYFSSVLPFQSFSHMSNQICYCYCFAFSGKIIAVITQPHINNFPKNEVLLHFGEYLKKYHTTF